MKIVIDNCIPYIKGVFEPYAEVMYMAGSEIAHRDIVDADVLVVRTRTMCDRALLEGTRISMIASATIGFDHIDMEYCDAAGIKVATAAGSNARGVLQWVGAALAYAARVGGWEPSQKTIGVVGVGHVGSLVAQYARKWGFQVLCCDPPRARAESVAGKEDAVSDTSAENTELVIKNRYSVSRLLFFRPPRRSGRTDEGVGSFDKQNCKNLSTTAKKTEVENAAGASAESHAGAEAENTAEAGSENLSGAGAENTAGASAESHAGAEVENTAGASAERLAGAEAENMAEAGSENLSGAEAENTAGAVAGFVEFDEIVRRCDVVTFHVPLTRTGPDATYYMADAAFFASFRPGTLIINTSRGEVIDSEALLGAVMSGRCACCIDTWENEPDIDRALLANSLLATPHIAGYSVQGKANATAAVVRAVARQYSLPLELWYPEDVQRTEPAPISWSALQATIAQHFDIHAQSRALKARPECFEEFRDTYIYRQEYF